ncbi:MAG: response regulator transcription factor [Candidatus Riflebacteria bacterium]|nr:response regulator transcription factor [Candidatus Riflebacteria bacterium]
MIQNHKQEIISLIIVDDHALVRQGIRAFLETQPDISIVGEAENGSDAITLCAEHAPDVVMLDLIMPGMNGVEAARKIKEVSPRTHILILTSYHDEEHIFPAMKAGAQSYLLKDVSPEDLIKAIRKAAIGETTLHPKVASQLIQALTTQNRTRKELGASELSSREMQVLKLIAEGNTNMEIAEVLFISEKTVKSHVTNILSKLHLSDRTKAAVFAWQNGLIQKTPSS